MLRAAVAARRCRSKNMIDHRGPPFCRAHGRAHGFFPIVHPVLQIAISHLPQLMRISLLPRPALAPRGSSMAGRRIKSCAAQPFSGEAAPCPGAYRNAPTEFAGCDRHGKSLLAAGFKTPIVTATKKAGSDAGQSMWWRIRDSNPRPLACDASALTS